MAEVSRINHSKIVVLTLLAALVIMLIGITASVTDDTNGYGITATVWPLSTNSATVEGISPTQYSSALIFLGTPVNIVHP
jgi:hypothetical protein